MKIASLITGFHVVREVSIPEHDKTATPYVYGNPYRRIRQDDLGLYVVREGVKRNVTLHDVRG